MFKSPLVIVGAIDLSGGTGVCEKNDHPDVTRHRYDHPRTPVFNVGRAGRGWRPCAKNDHLRLP